MAESVLTSKGQITIPKSIRKLLKLKAKDKIIFVPDGDHIIMVPVKENILDLYGSVKHKGGPLDFKKLRKKVTSEVARKALGNRSEPDRR